jgi:hypothetical protein
MNVHYIQTPIPCHQKLVYLYDDHRLEYSGGQATEGQGGYYGSGGARHIPPPSHSQDTARSQLLALAADVQKVHATMSELEKLEHRALEESSSSNTTSKSSMEIRATMKKLMTQQDFLESLNRLEVQGEPVWGLSTAEREMITLARRKVNES